MKKRKIIALTLLVAFLFSLCIPGTLAIAEDGDDTPAENKGMEISKTATDNGDGTYTITLEAYATGEKITSTVNKDVPTDIVLVLDQSGSMATEDFPSVSETTYTAYIGDQTQNSNLYSKRHNNNGNNGNLYYSLEDGSYATVSVTRTQGADTYTYTECPTEWKNYTKSSRDDDYWKYSNNLYVKNEAGEYQKVTVSYEDAGGIIFKEYNYIYTFPNGNTVKSIGNAGQPGLNNFDGNGPVYYISDTTAGEYTYTYTCTDAEGETIEIGTSTGANTNFTGATLYSRSVANSDYITRLQALKNAVTGFNNAVAQKAAGKDGILGTEDDIDHRIAVVGFATGNYSNNNDYPTYENTELFIGATQYNYNVNASSYYGSAFQNMNTQAGYDNVIASKNALAARGATYTNYGLMMANGILDANPVPEGQRRNRVIIVFTDGQPGYSSYDSDVAENAITEAENAKNAGTTVYAVGIFSGADATSAGNASGDDTEKANWFMQKLSSNNGTPQTPSYYLSAADADTLNSIFQQISDQIESGGSYTTLGEEAVIKDIIAPAFALPEGTNAANITLETYSYTGENQWTKNADAMGATATVSGDQVSVTGFDFAENWCGTETVANGTTTYRGNKLVISFNVVAKDGFLGGNGVYTNTSAGVYESSFAENPLFTFERPQVDVPIKDITVSPEDKNVYLTGSLTTENLQSGTTVKVGNEVLDLSKEYYGLESWQTEYVTITMGEVTDKENNVIDGSLSNLTEDQTYTVSVKVTPIIPGTYEEKNNTGTGSINVFKPELTFMDEDVYYGDNAPTDFSGNLVSTVWKHGDTTSTDTNVTMIGDAPTLNMTYSPDAGKIENGKINSKKEDISVGVIVKIEGMNDNENLNSFVTFVHQACNPACGWTTPNPNNGNPAFLLHPKTCQLTITKTGGADDEPYVFDVYKDNTKYSEVTITGNGSEKIYELPVGTYTIQEDSGWSWRYTASYGDSVDLTAQNNTGTITCDNDKTENYWLNGYSAVVKNIFGVSHNKSTN